MLPGKTYTVDEVLAIARKRYWWILVPLAVISAATAVVARRMPDTYESRSVMVVIPQRIPEAYVKSTVTMRVQDRLNAIAAWIRSRSQLEETIKKFNLYAEERRAGALDEDIVEKMRREVMILPSVNGEAFTIGYTGPDPRVVTRVTEYLTTSFINQSLLDRSSVADSTSQFLDTELENAKRQLLAHEEKLLAYNQRHSGELPTQQVSNLQAIANIQMQIQSVLNQQALLQERRRTLTREIQNDETMASLFPPETTAPVTANPAIGVNSAALRLARARAHLDSLLTLKMTEEHPEVKTARRTITQLEKEVEADALRQPVSAVTPRSTTPAQFMQQKKIETMKADLEDVTRQIADLQASEIKLRQQSSTYQYRADAAPMRASELVEITRDYTALQGQYASLLLKRNESKIAANLEDRQIGEQFRLLDPARLPERPRSPNRSMINLMGIGAGLGVGLMLVGLLEYRDSSFKTDYEVTNLLTLPVLAVVPLMLSDEDRQRTMRRRLITNVGLGGTVLGCFAVLVYTFVR
jgi:polysaccharide chain length determinant protein (PEP-CTERM system associated)